MSFAKSTKNRKLHRSITRFFEIFIRIDFVFDIQKTHFRGRCDRYRDDGVALKSELSGPPESFFFLHEKKTIFQMLDLGAQKILAPTLKASDGKNAS